MAPLADQKASTPSFTTHNFASRICEPSGDGMSPECRRLRIIQKELATSKEEQAGEVSLLSLSPHHFGSRYHKQKKRKQQQTKIIISTNRCDTISKKEGRCTGEDSLAAADGCKNCLRAGGRHGAPRGAGWPEGLRFAHDAGGRGPRALGCPSGAQLGPRNGQIPFSVTLGSLPIG